MEDAIAGSGIGDVFEDARNSYLLKRMEATAKRTIWALMLQVRKGKFVPSGFEVSFSRAERLDAVQFQLGEDEKCVCAAGSTALILTRQTIRSM